QLAVLGALQGVEHGPAPLTGAKVHDAGGGRRRDAADVEVAGQVAGGQGAVREDAGGALPVGPRQGGLVLDEVAERVADGPRPADEPPDGLLAAQALQAAGVERGE